MKVTVTACKPKRTKVEVNAVTSRRETVRVPVKRMESQPHIYVKARNVTVREKYRPEDFDETELLRELFAEDVPDERTDEDDGLPEIFRKPLNAMREVEDSISMDNLPMYFDPRALTPEEEDAEEIAPSRMAAQWDEQNGQRSEAFRNSFGGYGVPSSNVRAVDRNTTEAELLDIIDRQQRRGSEQSAERAERIARERAVARERAERAARNAEHFDDVPSSYSEREEEDIYNWWSDIETQDAPAEADEQPVEHEQEAQSDERAETAQVDEFEEAAQVDELEEAAQDDEREEKAQNDEREEKAQDDKPEEKTQADEHDEKAQDDEHDKQAQSEKNSADTASYDEDDEVSTLRDASKTFHKAKRDRKNGSKARSMAAQAPAEPVDDPDLEYGEIYAGDLPELEGSSGPEYVDFYLVDESANAADTADAVYDDGAALPSVGGKFAAIKEQKKAAANGSRGTGGKNKHAPKDKLPDIPGARYMVRNENGELVERDRKDIVEGQAVYIVDEFGKLLSGSGAIYGRNGASAGNKPE